MPDLPSPCGRKFQFQFQFSFVHGDDFGDDLGGDLGSDHLQIKITIDAQPHRNIHTNPTECKFNHTDREELESTLEAALSLGDAPELQSTQDTDKYADSIVTAISTAVGKARGGTSTHNKRGCAILTKKVAPKNPGTYLKLRLKNPGTHLNLRPKTPRTRNARLSFYMRKLATLISILRFSFNYFITIL